MAIDHQATMEEMLHNFRQMAELLMPVIRHYPELVEEFEAITEEADAALDEMHRAAEHMAAVGSRIVTFAQRGAQLTCIPC
jgi:hypothetical protein